MGSVIRSLTPPHHRMAVNFTPTRAGAGRVVQHLQLRPACVNTGSPQHRPQPQQHRNPSRLRQWTAEQAQRLSPLSVRFELCRIMFRAGGSRKRGAPPETPRQPCQPQRTFSPAATRPPHVAAVPRPFGTLLSRCEAARRYAAAFAAGLPCHLIAAAQFISGAASAIPLRSGAQPALRIAFRQAFGRVLRHRAPGCAANGYFSVRQLSCPHQSP